MDPYLLDNHHDSRLASDQLNAFDMNHLHWEKDLKMLAVFTLLRT